MALKKIGGPITSLTSPVDYNTMTTTGVYHQVSYNNARASTNGASVNPGLLEVFSVDGAVFQRFTVYQGSRVYARDYYGYIDTWSAWRELTA